MFKFIGRKKELAMLDKTYLSQQTEFIPIYGRRRIGKSELILHFIKDKPSLYFLGKQSGQLLQIKEFMSEAARVFKQPLLKSTNITDWKTALQAVVAQKKNGGKLILVFDEFQWIAQASPDLQSIFQELLDLEWKKRKDILLIICGSYMGFMEKQILGSKSPLFGRRTAQILLKPFSYIEAGMFHPEWSVLNRAKTYFICGGIPFYLRFFSKELSVEQNIINNFLNEFAALFREPDFLLREELRELEKYYSILMALSSGSLSNSEMSKATGINERKLYYYVQNLIELGYLSKHYPLTENSIKTRNVKFVLNDPLLKFWFRFIYPNTSYISQMSAEKSYQNIIKPYLNSYFGNCFERLCRESLAFLYMKEGVACSFNIGEFWNKKVQIDVVGYRQDDLIDIGECKWGKVSSLNEVEKELKNKIINYPNKNNSTIQMRLFTRYNKKNRNISSRLIYHSLDEMYNLEW